MGQRAEAALRFELSGTCAFDIRGRNFGGHNPEAFVHLKLTSCDDPIHLHKKTRMGLSLHNGPHGAAGGDRQLRFIHGEPGGELRTGANLVVDGSFTRRIRALISLGLTREGLRNAV
jgi:hypothetical protein